MIRCPDLPRPARARIREFAADDFDLRTTLESGQSFHWVPAVGGYAGCIGETPCWIAQENGRLRFAGARLSEVQRYFALDDDLAAISATWPGDPAMVAARQFAWGMRILRQPPWECLAAFITSSLKQVAHIAAISQAVRRRWSAPGEVAGCTVHPYPPPEVLAAADESDLRACGLGFRAPYLLGSARAVADGKIDLNDLRRLSTAEIRSALCALPGVGEKIANCVLLFAYHRLEAFPIDVWIERVLRLVYFRRRKTSPLRLREFAARHFGPYGGYAQQYLFHHVRLTRGASLDAAGAPGKTSGQRIPPQKNR